MFVRISEDLRVGHKGHFDPAEHVSHEADSGKFVSGGGVFGCGGHCPCLGPARGMGGPVSRDLAHTQNLWLKDQQTLLRIRAKGKNLIRGSSWGSSVGPSGSFTHQTHAGPECVCD